MLKRFLFVVLAACFLFALAACDGTVESVPESNSESETDSTAPDPTVTLSETSKELYVGQTVKLFAEVKNSAENAVWSSGDPLVATVDQSGTVTAVAIGTAQIKAAVSGAKAECEVNVSKPELAVSLNKSTLNLVIGQNFTIVPTTTADDKEIEATYKFESKDSNVASVTDKGVISAKCIGTINVTVTAQFLSFEKSVEVSVIVTENVSLELPVLTIKLASDNIGGVSFNSEYQITANVNENYEDIINPKLIYTSSHENVATVSKNGLVEYVGPGKTDITIKYISSSGTPFTKSLSVKCYSDLVTTSDKCWSAFLGSDLLYVNGIPQEFDVSAITAITLNENDWDFIVKNGKLFVNDVDVGLYFAEIFVGNESIISSFVVKETAASPAGWSDKTGQWMGGDDGKAYFGADYCYSSGRYRKDGTTLEYSSFAYSEGANVLSAELAEYAYDDFNSLLRIQLRYNGVTYDYDRNSNVWKDGKGAVNNNIRMYNADGSVADLLSLEKNGKGIYVKFVILGISTDLDIINNPPKQAYNNADTGTYVVIAFKNKLWHTIDSSLFEMFEYNVVAVAVTSEKTLTLTEGDTSTITAEAYLNGMAVKNAEFTYLSGNETIATVSNGIITAVKQGETVITVKYTADGKDYTSTVALTILPPIDLFANYYYDAASNTPTKDMPVMGLSEDIDVNKITAISVAGNPITFSVKDGKLFVPKVDAGIYEVVITDSVNGDSEHRIRVSKASVAALWNGGTGTWCSPGVGGIYAPDGTYYFSSGKFDTAGTREYTSFTYQSGMNVLSVELAGHNYNDFNSLLRIELEYNGTVYSYDGANNVWKDGKGNINTNISMYNSDGTPANLSKMATNSADVFVRFVIVGITTDLKLLNNPPSTAWNTDNTDSYVVIAFKNSMLYYVG